MAGLTPHGEVSGSGRLAPLHHVPLAPQGRLPAMWRRWSWSPGMRRGRF